MAGGTFTDALAIELVIADCRGDLRCFRTITYRQRVPDKELSAELLANGFARTSTHVG